MTNFITAFEASFQKDETWVVAELQKGWTILETDTQTAAIDATNIVGWVQAHQQQILTVFQGALTGAEEIGSIIPGAAPEVAAATVAIDAATAAIDIASQGLTQGTTPLSTLVNAYQLGKQAASAVNVVLQTATTKPTAAGAAAAASAAAPPAAGS